MKSPNSPRRVHTWYNLWGRRRSRTLAGRRCFDARDYCVNNTLCIKDTMGQFMKHYTGPRVLEDVYIIVVCWGHVAPGNLLRNICKAL
jgi:hypothetical protein